MKEAALGRLCRFYLSWAHQSSAIKANDTDQAVFSSLSLGPSADDDNDDGWIGERIE